MRDRKDTAYPALGEALDLRSLILEAITNAPTTAAQRTQLNALLRRIDDVISRGMRQRAQDRAFDDVFDDGPQHPDAPTIAQRLKEGLDRGLSLTESLGGRPVDSDDGAH